MRICTDFLSRGKRAGIVSKRTYGGNSQFPPGRASVQIWSALVQQQLAPMGETRHNPVKQAHSPLQQAAPLLQSCPCGMHASVTSQHAPAAQRLTHVPLPLQTPQGTPWHTVPCALFVGAEQVPVSGLQAPAFWHSFAEQVTGVPAPQLPLVHDCAHLLPQRVPSALGG
jgi:hypothetical protein